MDRTPRPRRLLTLALIPISPGVAPGLGTLARKCFKNHGLCFLNDWFVALVVRTRSVLLMPAFVSYNAYGQSIPY